MTSVKFIEELSRANLSSAMKEKLLSLGKVIKVKNKARLVVPNKVCDKGYFILKGGFVCRYIDEELEIEKTINFFLDDFQPFMTCVDSYFSDTPTNCELVAIYHSEIIMFHKKDIEGFLYDNIEFFKYYQSLMIMALQGENDFKMKIISYSSERLYTYLITYCPLIIQRVPARYVAEFMGISQEWLSKLKHRI